MPHSYETESIRQQQAEFDRDNLTPFEDLLVGGSYFPGEDPYTPRAISQGMKSPQHVFAEREEVEALIGAIGAFGKSALHAYTEGETLALQLAPQSPDNPSQIVPEWKVRMVRKDTFEPIEDPASLQELEVQSGLNKRLRRFYLAEPHDYYRDIRLRGK